MAIVEAVGAAAGVRGPGGKELAATLEAAMTLAVTDALADGLRPSEDADAIRERVLAARQAAKEQYFAQFATPAQGEAAQPE